MLLIFSTSYLQITSLDIVGFDYLHAKALGCHTLNANKREKRFVEYLLCACLFTFQKYQNPDCHTCKFVPMTPGSGHSRNTLLSLIQSPGSFLQLVGRLMSCLILPILTRSGSCTLVMGEGRSARKEEPVLGFSCDACNGFFLGAATSCKRVLFSSLYISPPPPLFSWLFF